MKLARSVVDRADKLEGLLNSNSSEAAFKVMGERRSALSRYLRAFDRIDGIEKLVDEIEEAEEHIDVETRIKEVLAKTKKAVIEKEEDAKIVEETEQEMQ